ncbi:hypothetical protein B566_EDAN007781 [Ephemera danica]|nr:hypothetical protein B566_EDAN007781 [Ephemera danica]
MLVRVLTLVAVLQVTFLSSTVRSDGIYKAIDPKEFVTIGGIRYYFSVILTDSITNAIRSCNDVGASLVSLETQAEYEAVTNYILKEQLGSGKLFGYANWAPGQPSVTDFRTPACVRLWLGQLYDGVCQQSFSFICEDACPTLH